MNINCHLPAVCGSIFALNVTPSYLNTQYYKQRPCPSLERFIKAFASFAYFGGVSLNFESTLASAVLQNTLVALTTESHLYMPPLFHFIFMC